MKSSFTFSSSTTTTTSSSSSLLVVDHSGISYGGRNNFIPPSPPLPPPDDDDSFLDLHPYHRQVLEKLKMKLPRPPLSTIESSFKYLIQNPPPCTRAVLAVVSHGLHDFFKHIQELAVNLLLTFSLDPANAAVLADSDAVHDLLLAFYVGTPRARARAAQAIYNLVAPREDREEHSSSSSSSSSIRVKVGAHSDIVPALMTEFLGCRSYKCCTGLKYKKKMLLPLYYLALRPENAKILVVMGAVSALLDVVADKGSTASLRRYALMLMHPLMGSEMGRHMLFDYKLVGGGGGGGGVVLLLRCLRDHGKNKEKNVGLHCLIVMYRVCWESTSMFIKAASSSSAGAAEKLLAEEAEECGESGKELAREMVRVLRGEIRSREEMREARVFLDLGESDLRRIYDDNDNNEDGDRDRI